MVAAEAASARAAALQRTMLLCCGKEGGEGGMRLRDGASIHADACPHRPADTGVHARGVQGDGGTGGYPLEFAGGVATAALPLPPGCPCFPAPCLALAASAAGWREAPGTRPSPPVPGTALPANNERSQRLPHAGGGSQLPVHGAAGAGVQHPQGCVLRVPGPGPETGVGCGGWARSALPTVCLGPPYAARQMPGKSPQRLRAPSLAPLRAQQTEHKWHLGSRGGPSLLPPSPEPYKSPRLRLWLRFWLAKGQERRGEGGQDGRQLQRGADGGGTSGKEHPSPSPGSQRWG